MSSELLGSTEVKLKDLVNDGVEAYNLRERRQQQIDDLHEHGRMVEMEELLKKFKRENEEYKQRRLDKEAVADKSSVPSFVERTIKDWDPECGCCAKYLEEDEEEGALHATAKYRREHGRTWSLHSTNGTQTGKVNITVELLHKDVADAHPAGKGQSKPNKHPVLEEPDRENISFWRPFGEKRLEPAIAFAFGNSPGNPVFVCRRVEVASRRWNF